MTGRIQVVYVAGWSRSGSTLLDRLLGEADGVASLGEVRHLWTRGIVENQLCGCGEPIPDCRFWQKVLDEAFGGDLPVRPEKVPGLVRTLNHRMGPSMVRRSTRWSKDRTQAWESLERVLGPLYRAAAKVSGAQVLVDSSKLSTYGAILQMLEGVDTSVVHLVRDSRAVAHSLQRKRKRPEIRDQEAYMPRLGAGRAATYWSWYNVLSGMLAHDAPRSLRLRYEDLARAPRLALERVFEALELEPEGRSFLKDDVAELSMAHTAAGNPMRFETGRVPIRVDDAWIQVMDRRDRWLVTAMTWPLLLRWGYPVAGSIQA